MRILKWAAIAAGAVLVLLLIALGALFLFVSSDKFKSILADRAGSATGREVEIAGDIDIDWGRTTRVTLNQLKLGNADWGSEPLMAAAERVEFTIRLPALLRGDVVLPEVVMIRPAVLLERNQEGKTNWDFSQNPDAAAAAEAVSPDDRSEFPVIGRLVVRDGRVTYRDPAHGIDLASRVDTLTTAAPVCSPVPCVPATQALQLLVVDDYPANRLLLARQLTFLGHQIVTAEDGAEGFARWQTGHFDGVITDCNMPVMDGYTLARDIRAQERQRGLVPCLLLGFTANAQPEEVERCRQAGMDGCLFKPTGLDDLRAALASRTASAVTGEAKAQFDLSSLVMLTGDDAAVLNELLAPLLISLAEDLRMLSTLQDRADFAKLYDLAHRVKGGARMVKAQALITCCEALEDACERRDGDAVAVAVAALSVAIDGLHHDLSQYCKQA